MRLFILFLFVTLSLCSGTKISGYFDHCTKEFCEIIKEIELVKNFEKCTKLPIVKFFSLNLKKVVPAVVDFVDGVGKLITSPQEEVICERKIKNQYKNFDIIREDKTADVVFHETSNIENGQNFVDLINTNYFDKPMKYIVKDILIIVSCIVIFVIILMKIINCIVKAEVGGKSLKCCLCFLGIIMARLIAKKNKNKEVKDEEINLGMANTKKKFNQKPQTVKNVNVS
jgi:hypothetical protein